MWACIDCKQNQAPHVFAVTLLLPGGCLDIEPNWLMERRLPGPREAPRSYRPPGRSQQTNSPPSG